MIKSIRTRVCPLAAGLILFLFGFYHIGTAQELMQGTHHGTKQEAKQKTNPQALPEAPKPPCLTANGAVIKANDIAFMRINYQSEFYFAWRDTGSGPDGTKPTTDFYFRRNRLTLSGQATEDVSYDVKIEQMGPERIGPVDVSQEPVENFEVLEASVDAELSRAFHVTVGKTKIPFTREVLEACFTPLTLDRSLFIDTPTQRTRDMGVIFWGNIINSKVQYIAAIQEGQDSGTTPESSPRYTGRVHLAMLDPEDAFGYEGTYLGNKMVFTVGAAGQYEPGAVFTDTVNKTGAQDYKAWTYDIFIEYPVGDNGSVDLSGAYVETNFDHAYQGGVNADPSSIGIDGQKKGWYAKAGYLFLDKIGPGQIQPFARYEQWDFANLNGVVGQKIRWTGAGLNYLINGQNLRLTVQYAKTDFRDEDNAASRDFTTITSMFQFGF